MKAFLIFTLPVAWCLLVADGFAQSDTATSIDSLAGKRIVFLGDSITQAGDYVSFASYYLERLFPLKDFDIYSLGLASETLSGLSEEGHAGGAFPRPCLFERLGRLLDKVRPEVVFACYGINDGIYRPLDDDRFAAFKEGVRDLIKACKAAGAKEIFIVTPPIFDFSPKEGEFNYDGVMTAYAAWEMTIQEPGVRVIDLHTAMRRARDSREGAFSNDRVHPGADGHLLMAKTILHALGIEVPDEGLAAIHEDPLFQQVDVLRKRRATRWMHHIGYTREKVVEPQPLITLQGSEPIAAFAPGSRILFQGDSITDGNRGRNADPNHILGHGYAFIIASKYGAAFAEGNLDFMNRGVSGNTVRELEQRWDRETLELKPDILSILIGVNDQSSEVPLEEYESTYDALITQARTLNPKLKLVLCEPFTLPVGKRKDGYMAWRAGIQARQAIVAKLAAKHDSALVLFQKVFDAACEVAPAAHWIWDGVHPTYSGHQLMADEWERTVRSKWPNVE